MTFIAHQNGNQRLLYTHSPSSLPKYRGTVASLPRCHKDGVLRREKPHWGIGDATEDQRRRTRSRNRTLFGESSQVKRLAPNPSKVPQRVAGVLALRRDDEPVALVHHRTMSLGEKAPRPLTIRQPRAGGAVVADEPTFEDTFSTQGLTKHMVAQLKLRALQTPGDPKLAEEVNRLFAVVQSLAEPKAAPKPSVSEVKVGSTSSGNELSRPKPVPIAEEKAKTKAAGEGAGFAASEEVFDEFADANGDTGEVANAAAAASTVASPASSKASRRKALWKSLDEIESKAYDQTRDRKAFLRRIKAEAGLPANVRLDKRSVKKAIDDKLRRLEG